MALVSCYIIDLLRDETISFKVVPDELTDSVSANWDNQEVRGRSAPYLGFNSVGARTVSYTVVLHEDYCNLGILSTVNKLKGLVYPNYTGSIVKPPKCYVRFGNMVGMYAIVENVSVTWEKPSIMDNHYAHAEVSLEFTECFTGSTLPNHNSVSDSGANVF